MFLHAQRIVRQSFPRQAPWMNPVNDKWTEYERVMPHMWSLWRIFTQADPPLEGSEELARMFCDAGNYLWEREQRDGGLAILQTAKTVSGSLPAAADRRVYVDTLCLMACLLCGSGITGRSQGMKYFEEVLELRKRHFLQIPDGNVTNADRFLLSNGYNDYACGHIHNSTFDEAEEPLNTALALKESCGTADEYKAEFAEAYKNIAYVLLAKGDKSTAVEMMSKATNLAISAYGESTAACQHHRFHLGCVTYAAGDHERALQVHEDVMRVRRDELFGEHHEHILNSLYAVSFIHWKADRQHDAR